MLSLVSINLSSLGKTSGNDTLAWAGFGIALAGYATAVNLSDYLDAILIFRRNKRFFS